MTTHNKNTIDEEDNVNCNNTIDNDDDDADMNYDYYYYNYYYTDNDYKLSFTCNDHTNKWPDNVHPKFHRFN